MGGEEGEGNQGIRGKGGWRWGVGRGKEGRGKGGREGSGRGKKPGEGRESDCKVLRLFITLIQPSGPLTTLMM